MKERRMILEKTKPIILGNHEFQDIDNEVDWLIGELKYSNLVGRSIVIDLGIQKWLFKRKINTNLFLRNVFNQKKRYHPIGASFDLTLYFHITYYPFKNY